MESQLSENDLETSYITAKCSILLVLWIVALAVTLAGLVFSMFLAVSYSDLQSGSIEPMELSESMN
jgi:hypothetical protein